MHIETIAARTTRAGSMVFIHGWGLHSGVFRPLARHYPQYDCHLVDLPGHGDSARPDEAVSLGRFVTQLSEALGQVDVVMGWSLGGLVAQTWALQYPQQVGRLILMASTPSFVTRDHWPQGMPLDVFKEFGRALHQDFDATLRRFIALEVFGSDTAKADRQTLWELTQAKPAPSLQALETGLQWLADSDLCGRLSTLQCPNMWIIGSRDRLVKPDAAAQAADLAHGDYCRIASAGHAPFLSHWPDCAAMIDPWLQEDGV